MASFGTRGVTQTGPSTVRVVRSSAECTRAQTGLHHCASRFENRRVAAADGLKSETFCRDPKNVVNPATEPTTAAAPIPVLALTAPEPLATSLAHESRNVAFVSRASFFADCTGPSTGSGTDLPPLPAEGAERVPCDAEARREPSRAVSSFSRKS